MIYRLAIEEQSFEVQINDIKDGFADVSVNGMPYKVSIENFDEVAPQVAAKRPTLVAPASVQAPKPTPKPSPAQTQAAGAGAITAPIPGLILQINVSVGDKVKPGQVVGIMEAMKMENDILAPISGTVKEVLVQKGAEVSTGDVVMVIA